MITFPPGFTAAALVQEFESLCVPFVEAIVIIAAGIIVMKILRRS